MTNTNSIQKAIKVFVPRTGASRFVQKPEIISVYTENTGKIKYVHNVLEYKPRQITPQEVKSLFIDGKIDGGYLKDEMKRIKRKLLKSSFTDISNFNIWKGYCSEDSIPNIEKLALFVRSIKRIDKLNFYKNLGEKEWENCIDGIIRKPREVVRALMEYKYDSSKINGAISFGTSSEKIKRQIQAIEKYLDNQTLKHDMEVYRGEGRFDVFNSVVLDKEKNITLKDILEKFTANIEEHKFNEKAVDDFVDKSL